MKFFRTWWLVGLLLVTLALAVAVVCLAVQLRARYESQLVQQVWPAGVVQPPVLTGPPPVGRVVLLVGDSRMAQWSGLSISNQTVFNAGQPGATTGQLCLRLPELLAVFHPATVVIQAGVNDLKLIGLKPELENRVVAQAAHNLSNLVADCSSRGCRVILLETWPVGPPEWRRRPVWNDHIPLAVVRLNAQLRLLATPAKNVQVLDIFQAAGFEPGPQSYRDALHFQPVVYQRLTPVLEQEIARTTVP